MFENSEYVATYWIMFLLRCVLVKGIPPRWNVKSQYVRSHQEFFLSIWMEPRNSCLRLLPAMLMGSPSHLKQMAMCLSSHQGRMKSHCMCVLVVAYIKYGVL